MQHDQTSHAQADTRDGHARLSERISLFPHDDGAVVFVNDTGMYLQVNAVGRTVLDGLMHGHSAADCITAIANEHQIDRHVVEHDVKQFLADLSRYVTL